MRENRETRAQRAHREKPAAPVESLVPLLVDETTRVRANAATRVARRPRPEERVAFDAFDSNVFQAASAPREPRSPHAPRDATRVERPAPATIDVGDLPTLVVPPPASMSSGARRRPHEIAEDVASDFEVSPFDSDIQTEADARVDSLFDGPASDTATSMADVWRDADARTPFFAPPPTSVPVDSVDVLEAVAVDVDVAPLDVVVSPRKTRRWTAFLLTMAVACALFVDDAALARTVSFGENAVGAAMNVVPQLRALGAQLR